MQADDPGEDPFLMPAYLRVMLAPMIASLAAGPLLLLASLPFLPAHGGPIPASVTDILNLVVLFILYGAFFSFLPNLVGTVVMFLLSRRWPLARRRRSWAAAGAAGSGLLVGLLDLEGLDIPFLLVLGAVGAGCAVICRHIARPD